MQRPSSHLARGAEKLQETVEVYQRRHLKPLLEHKNKVGEVLLTPMNGGLKAGMIDLAVQGGGLHRAYQYAPPRPAQASLWRR